MLLFANYNLAHLLVVFASGCGIGAVVLFVWTRNRQKHQVIQLRNSIRRIKKKLVPQPKSDDSLFDDLINDIFNLKRKSLQREKRFRKVGRRLNSVLNNMDVGVVILDASNTVIFSNNFFRELLGLSGEDITDRSISEIVRNPEIDQAITECVAGKSEFETEFETTRGPKRILQVRAGQMPRKSKAQTMLVLVDVTNLRQLENMRRDFVANVSHELKTPLASIKAYTETLRRGAIEDKENRMNFVLTIEEQANRLHQLIIDLIQLARIEQGNSAFVITDVELISIVLERIEEFRDDAAANKIALEFKTSADEIWIRADAEGIQTIVDNLLSNAIRYTPADGQVAVVCGQTESKAFVEVNDTGIGIGPDQQERIFERFYRVDKARSREKGGTGLGLSIVKHLTQSMGASISVDSSVGNGSKFSVSIPLTSDKHMDN